MLLVLTAMLAWTACQSHTEKITGGKSAANETAAIGALRAIASAQTVYATTHEGNYGTFAELVQAGNLDVRFSGERPVIGGYVLTMKVAPKVSDGQMGSYTVNADPQQAGAAGSTGTRHFYMDSSDNAVRVNATRPASASDPTL
jgi:hypothetical protein